MMRRGHSYAHWSVSVVRFLQHLQNALDQISNEWLNSVTHCWTLSLRFVVIRTLNGLFGWCFLSGLCTRTFVPLLRYLVALIAFAAPDALLAHGIYPVVG